MRALFSIPISQKSSVSVCVCMNFWKECDKYNKNIKQQQQQQQATQRWDRSTFSRALCLCVCVCVRLCLYLDVSNFKSKHIALALISAFFCSRYVCLHTSVIVHCVHSIPFISRYFCFSMLLFRAHTNTQTQASHSAVWFLLLSFRWMGSRFACFSYICIFFVGFFSSLFEATQRIWWQNKRCARTENKQKWRKCVLGGGEGVVRSVCCMAFVWWWPGDAGIIHVIVGDWNVYRAGYITGHAKWEKKTVYVL